MVEIAIKKSTIKEFSQLNWTRNVPFIFKSAILLKKLCKFFFVINFADFFSITPIIPCHSWRNTNWNRYEFLCGWIQAKLNDEIKIPRWNERWKFATHLSAQVWSIWMTQKNCYRSRGSRKSIISDLLTRKLTKKLER